MENYLANKNIGTVKTVCPDLAFKTFLLTYQFDDEIDGSERDLGQLYHAIQSLGPFAVLMDAVWILCTVLTIRQLHERLASFFEHEGRFFIVECNAAAEWGGIPVDTTVWLEREFNSAHRTVIRRRMA